MWYSKKCFTNCTQQYITADKANYIIMCDKLLQNVPFLLFQSFDQCRCHVGDPWRRTDKNILRWNSMINRKERLVRCQENSSVDQATNHFSEYWNSLVNIYTSFIKPPFYYTLRILTKVQKLLYKTVNHLGFTQCNMRVDARKTKFNLRTASHSDTLTTIYVTFNKWFLTNSSDT